MLNNEEDILNKKRTVMLYTGSAFNSVKSRKLIIKSENSQRPIVIKTNTGRRILKRKGEIPGIKEKIWYKKESIANIFSFSKVIDQYRIT